MKTKNKARVIKRKGTIALGQGIAEKFGDIYFSIQIASSVYPPIEYRYELTIFPPPKKRVNKK